MKPANAAIDACVSASEKAVADEFDSSAPEKKKLAKVRVTCQQAFDAQDVFADALEDAPWPKEAEDSIQDLIVEVQASQLLFRKLSKVKTFEAYWAADAAFAQVQGNAADIVRARLGLPLVGE